MLILAQMEHFTELLNVQNDRGDITENNYTTENSNVPVEIEVNVRFG
jgi:hypothetical protein